MSNEMRAITVEIGKLTLAPGDVLVLRVDSIISDEIHRRLKSYLEPLMPEGVKAMVLDKSMSLTALTQAEIAKRIAA